MERSKAGMKKKEVPTAYNILSKYNNNKHNMAILNKNWKKYNEIQFPKTENELDQSKNHPPYPEL